MAYGIIEYDDDGNPVCEICKKSFKRVLAHVRQKHFMNEREYKLQFGFDLGKGICSKDSSEKSRIKTLENFNKCIANNLLTKGATTRFVINSSGRTKDKVSEQTRKRLKARLKTKSMIAAMKKSGAAVGNSGLGNLTRWKNK